MRSFKYWLSIVLSVMLVVGDGALISSVFAKSRSGGYSKPSYGGSSRSYSGSSNWSGTTKDTWNRKGGGMFGGSSGYSKPSLGTGGGSSTVPVPPSGYSKPSLGGSGSAPPSIDPGTGFGRSSSGYSKPGLGTSPGGSGYSRPSVQDGRGSGYSLPGTGGASSGGYSKPSVGGGGTAPTGLPSTPGAVSPGSTGSGGYAKPGLSSGGQRPTGLSSLDQNAISHNQRQKSADSLQRYRDEQSKFKNPPVQTNQDYGSHPLSDKSRVYSGFDYNTHYNQRDNWFRGMNYSPPSYAFGGSPMFGVFSGLFLYWMLDHMSDKKVAAAAYHHSDDPGFKKWREEVEKQAKDNTELKAKLAEMDKQIAAMKGTPKDPGYLPPDVPAEVAVAPAVLAAKKPDKPVLRFASGRPGGVYDKFAQLLKKDAQNIDVEIRSTSGSMENLKLLADGEVDMAIVQSDVMALMQPGKRLMSEQAVLYPEYAQLIANRNSGIKSVKDIDPKKHTIFVGPKNSGTALTWQGLTEQSSFYRKIPVKYGEYQDGLAEVERNPNLIMLFVGGLNSDFLKKAEQDASKSGNLRLVQFDDKRFDNRRDEHGNRIYRFMEIPSSVYPELQRGWFFSGSVDTLAVDAVLVLRTEWAEKFGPEAMDILSTAINLIKPEIQKTVNAKN